MPLNINQSLSTPVQMIDYMQTNQEQKPPQELAFEQTVQYNYLHVIYTLSWAHRRFIEAMLSDDCNNFDNDQYQAWGHQMTHIISVLHRYLPRKYSSLIDIGNHREHFGWHVTTNQAREKFNIQIYLKLQEGDKPQCAPIDDLKYLRDLKIALTPISKQLFKELNDIPKTLLQFGGWRYYWPSVKRQLTNFGKLSKLIANNENNYGLAMLNAIEKHLNQAVIQATLDYLAVAPQDKTALKQLINAMTKTQIINGPQLAIIMNLWCKKFKPHQTWRYQAVNRRIVIQTTWHQIKWTRYLKFKLKID